MVILGKFLPFLDFIGQFWHFFYFICSELLYILLLFNTNNLRYQWPSYNNFEKSRFWAFLLTFFGFIDQFWPFLDFIWSELLYILVLLFNTNILSYQWPFYHNFEKSSLLGIFGYFGAFSKFQTPLVAKLCESPPKFYLILTQCIPYYQSGMVSMSGGHVDEEKKMMMKTEFLNVSKKLVACFCVVWWSLVRPPRNFHSYFEFKLV